MGLLYKFIDMLLLECYWNVGQVGVELAFLPDCDVVRRGVGTFLLGVDLTITSGVSWSSSSSL